MSKSGLTNVVGVLVVSLFHLLTWVIMSIYEGLGTPTAKEM